MEMISVKEAAKNWGLTERRVASLCKEEKIYGARKQGRSWLIPLDAEKPADNRIKTGAYRKDSRRANLPLPVGVSDYRVASEKYYYVDKTLMIRDFLDEIPIVSLFTRPRRFGKTLNMDMLRVFFEKTPEDTSIYFRDKKIWKCGERYREHQGKYPVIFLTFKDMKFPVWKDMLEGMGAVVADEFLRHRELLESEKCNEYEKIYFRKILERRASFVELSAALKNLSQMLDEHYGVAPIIIIDEYDTPIQQGYSQGFYDEIILLMRNLFSGGFKDNRHLSYGFMTGILRVAKESIFSGLNNLKVNSILDSGYSEYFGFTAEEVRDLAEYYGVSDHYEELCKWYDGYLFGETDIFNPWSVINYFGHKCRPGAYWLSTGSNDIVGEILEEADADIYKRLDALMQGESFVTYVDTGVIYPQIQKNPSSVYSFLLMAGYLKAIRTDAIADGYMCEVALPNEEITYVYRKEILEKFSDIVPASTAVAVQEAIYLGDGEALKRQLGAFLRQSASYYDSVGENFYHGLVLGFCAILDNRYQVTSNRESGEGRYDIQLLPREKHLPGVLIELKWEKGCSEERLKDLADEALRQVNDRGYDTQMRAAGVRDVVKYGIAFCGKRAEISEG